MRIRKAGKDLAKKLPIKIKDIHKIEKKNSIDISDLGYENKEKHSIYVSEKCCEEKHVALLFIYKKHIAFGYDYKLVCVYGMFGKDADYNFINSTIKERKYCSEVRKKHFNREPVMTNEDNESFKSSMKCWICDDDYVDNDIK